MLQMQGSAVSRVLNVSYFIRRARARATDAQRRRHRRCRRAACRRHGGGWAAVNRFRRAAVKVRPGREAGHMQKSQHTSTTSLTPSAPTCNGPHRRQRAPRTAAPFAFRRLSSAIQVFIQVRCTAQLSLESCAVPRASGWQLGILSSATHAPSCLLLSNSTPQQSRRTDTPWVVTPELVPAEGLGGDSPPPCASFVECVRCPQ